MLKYNYYTISYNNYILRASGEIIKLRRTKLAFIRLESHLPGKSGAGMLIVVCPWKFVSRASFLAFYWEWNQ